MKILYTFIYYDDKGGKILYSISFKIINLRNYFNLNKLYLLIKDMIRYLIILKL